MSKFSKGIITAILAVFLTVGGLRAVDLTSNKMSFDTPRYHLIFNAFIDAVQTEFTALSNLITNWAPVENVLTMVPAIPTYVDGDTFTLPVNELARFPAGAVVQARIAAGSVESTVASSSYGAGVTTVNLNNAVLTNPIARVYVVATRPALFPYGNGEVNALDYALGTPSQEGLQAAIDSIGISNRTMMLPPGFWPVSSRLNVPANIALKPAKGAVLTVTIPDVAIADLSRAAACVVSWVGHGMSSGDKVYLSGITQAEWTALNGHHLVTKINNDSFSIPVNTSAYAVGYVPGTDPGIYSQTIQIDGPVDAGPYQIFSGTGKVIFGAGVVKEVYSEWWGALGNNVQDDGNFLLAAYNSLTTGNVKLLGKSYKTTVTIIPKAGVGVIGVGTKNTQIYYVGTGFWIDAPTPVSVNICPNVVIKDMTINIATGALGGIRHGRIATAFSEQNFDNQWNLKNLYLIGANDAGSIGLSLTQIGVHSIRNIWVAGFSRNIVDDRCTDGTWDKVRTQVLTTNGTGIEFIKNDATGSSQEYVHDLNVELWAAGGGGTGVLIDAGNISISNVFYENDLGANTNFLHLTANAAMFSQTHAVFGVATGSMTNFILFDNHTSIYNNGSFVDNKFMGAGTVTFGTVGANYVWTFVAPNEFLATALMPAVQAKKVTVVGGAALSNLTTPGAKAMRNSSVQTITTATPTLLIFDAEDWDYDGMINISGAPTKITIKTPGVYSLSAILTLGDSATGIRYVRIIKNGTVLCGNMYPAASVFGTQLSTSGICKLVAGDYLEVEVYQTSGGNLNVSTTASLAAQLLSNSQ